VTRLKEEKEKVRGREWQKKVVERRGRRRCLEFTRLLDELQSALGTVNIIRRLSTELTLLTHFIVRRLSLK